MAGLASNWRGRTVGAFLAALFLIGAVGSGLDRIAVKSANPERYVPSLFADASLSSAASKQLSNEDFARAEKLSAAALRRSPLEADTSGILGTARLGLGRRGPADEAFRVSGQLGWRSALTQLYWLQIGLNRGEYNIAAERLDALLRDNPAEAQRPELFSGFSDNAEGQRALAKRLALAPGWRNAYFLPNADASVSELRARAANLDDLGPEPALDCATSAPLVDRLVRDGEPKLGMSVWRSQCDVAGDELLFDPGLTRSGARRLSPFAWQTFGTALTASEAGAVLTSEVSFTRRFARQILVLEPGKYRLSWNAEDEAGQPSPRISASFGCTADAPGNLVTVPSASTTHFAKISVTGACKSQFLVLSLKPGNGTVRLTHLQLVPAN